LERKHPDKPMQPGRVKLLEHEYIRHGTQALIANLSRSRNGHNKGAATAEIAWT
jgi:hypothetical protein